MIDSWPYAIKTLSGTSSCASAAKRVSRRHLHLFVDAGGVDIERAAEDEGEAENVIDLIDVVAATGADDGIGADFQRQLRHDLRRGVSQDEEHGIGRHAQDHLLRD